jgi:hypothetical protein
MSEGEIIKFVLCILLCCFCSFGFAQQEKVKVYPDVMTFSYVNHPSVVNVLLPLIKETYQRLGINVNFVEQPSARNLRLAAKGVTDGDTAYSDLLVDFHDNLITVGPELIQSHFVLLCHVSAHCSLDVLNDPTKTVVLTDASRDGLEYKLKDKLKSELYSINSLSRIPKLIDGRRLVYGVYVVADLESNLDAYPNLKFVHLFTTKTHHILNDKYDYLANDVAKSMQQVMKEQGMTSPMN